MRTSAVLRKSITDLTRRRGRATLAIAALALAVASVGLFALAPIMDRSMQDEVGAARLSDLSVSMRPLVLDDAVLAQLAALPNVEAVEARSWYPTRVYVGERRADAAVIGVRDFARQGVDVVALRAGRAPADGELMTETQDASDGLYAAGAGDVARLLASDGSVRSLPIAGEGHNVDVGQEVLSEGTIMLYATPGTVEALSGRPGISGLAFRLEDPTAADQTLAAVRRTLEGVPGFAGFSNLPDIRPPGEWPGREEFETYASLLTVITLLALVSALVLIAGTMNTLVGEQVGEIGAMRAIGARRRQLAAVYLRTALLLGTAATVLGAPLGVLLANALAGFLGPEFFAIEPAVAVDVPVLLASVAVGLAAPALAALPAVRRAARLRVREAIDAAGSAAAVAPGSLDAALRRVDFLPATAQIGLRDVGRRWRRSVSTVLQVAFAVAVMLALLGLVAAAERSTVGAWDEHGEDVAVWSAGRPLDDAAADVIAAVPGVARVEPVMKNEVAFAGDDAFLWGLVHDTTFHHAVTDGRWYSAAEERALERVAVIERDLARVTGTEVGDEVSVSTANGDVALRVIGVAANLQESGTVLFVPMATLRDIVGDADGYDYSVRASSRDEGAIDRVASGVEDALAAAGYAPASEVTYVARQGEVEANETLTMTIVVLGLVIVAISMVGLAGALTVSVLQRTRELAVLRCLGARARDVRRIVGVEGVAIALLGWLVGVPLGYVLHRLLIWATVQQIEIEIAPAFPAVNVLLALVGTLLLTLVAMLPPLARAVRLRPGDALRYG